MKTKTTLITIGIIVLVLIAYLIVSTVNSPIDKAIKQAKIEKKDDQPATKEEQEKEQNDEEEVIEEQTEDNVAGKVKDLFTGAVQETVDFFTDNEAKVVAIGDSLTQGVGDDTENGGYVGILDEALNTTENTIVEFENYGKRGRRTDQLLKYLEDPNVTTSVADADIVLITIGANDIMQVVKENFADITMDDFSKARMEYEVRLKKVFEKIYKLNPNADVYLLGFYDPFGRYFPQIKELGIIVRNWNQTSERIAESYNNATYIPTLDLFEDPNIDLFWKDNFHPNFQGYHRIAARVLEYLNKS
ncbi:SGNH/GDSL hydrolase family protein [Virgibacillus flavescens]|uniref:SGNH/GDSL hydrolase family protein n=1 Tax=Virgibacillus flavescens TaxID=1611422 RepID=UPI003D347BAD